MEPPPSTDNQKIRQLVVVSIRDGRGNLSGCFHSLNPDRQQSDTAQRVPLPQNPQHIKTVWGKGYRFE